MINEHQGGVECRSPSTPPRYCLLLLVAPGAFPRARSAAVSQLHTALAPSGGLCPPLLRSPCAAAAAPSSRCVGVLAHCSAAAPRCALARRSFARRRPRSVRTVSRSASLRGRCASAPPLRGVPPSRAGPLLAPPPRLMRAPRVPLGVRRRFWRGFGRCAPFGRRSSAPSGAQGARVRSLRSLSGRLRAPPPAGAFCAVRSCVACRQCHPVGN